MIIYSGGSDPTLPTYPFTFPDGVRETLTFNPQEWRYYWHRPEGTLVPLDGVTGVTKICSPAKVLMAWAVKVALLRAKQLLMDGGYVGEDANILFEEHLDEILAKAKKEDTDILEAAGAVGTAAHDWLEHLIKAKDNEERRHELLAKFPLDERAANCAVAGVDWMVRHNVRWIHTERKCFSRKYGYAGTMDGLAFVDSCDDPDCCKHEFKDRKSVIDWKSSNALRVSYLFQCAAYRQAYQEETGEDIKDTWILRLDKETGEFDPWRREGQAAFEEDFKGFQNCLETCRSIERAEEWVSTIKTGRTSKRKAEEKEAKMLEQKVKCKNSEGYKGVRLPTCNHGDPCAACLKKWADRHPKECLTTAPCTDTLEK